MWQRVVFFLGIIAVIIGLVSLGDDVLLGGGIKARWLPPVLMSNVTNAGSIPVVLYSVAILLLGAVLLAYAIRQRRS